MSRHDAKQKQKPRWPLLEAGYAPATVRKYRPAVLRFIDWCLRTGQDAQSIDDFDELLADYFQQIHDENDGAGKSIAVATLSGVRMYMPRLKDPSALPIASAVCNRWSRSKPTVSYPPLTWELAVAIACQMARAGHYRFGVATLVGFDCLLRKNELVSIRREDFADGKDARLGFDYQQAVVSIEKAKTGRFQSVEVERPAVRALLTDLANRTKPRQPLFPGGAQKYYDVFKQTCANLGLSDRYVPHSLRHGGATSMKLRGWSLEDIMQRGRWKSAMSARTYIDAGRAMLMAVKVPASIAAAGQALAHDVGLAMALTQKHKVKGG